MTAVEKIATIKCLEELDGYEAEAARRTVSPEERIALQRRRQELSK